MSEKKAKLIYGDESQNSGYHWKKKWQGKDKTEPSGGLEMSCIFMFVVVTWMNIYVKVG